MDRNIHNTITLKSLNVMHFYIFKSTNEEDSISRISIFTTSTKKAFALAQYYLDKHNCQGEPAMLAL